MSTIDLNLNNFEQIIENNDIVLIDFWAEWCGPCKNFGPVFEDASEKHEDVVFGKVNTEENRELASRFGVRSIPTVAILREKVLLYNQAGALPAPALQEIIDKVKTLDMEQVRAEASKG